jgi:hypothetical protein
MAENQKKSTKSVSESAESKSEPIVPGEDLASVQASSTTRETEASSVVVAAASAEEIVAAAEASAQVDAIVPSEEDAANVKEVVAELFEVMGVKRVISVDDDYEGTLEDFLAMAAVAAAVEAPENFADEFDLTEPQEVWQSQITERWSELTETEQHLLLARGKKLTGHSDPEDQPDAGAVHQLLPGPDKVEFLALTPAEWARQRDDVVRTAETLPTLLLFDRNLGDRTDEGLRLAEEVFSMDARDSIYVAILTRTVVKGGESVAWKGMIESFPNLVPERFVIVSKEDLGPEPESFSRSIKIVLTTRAAALLRGITKDAISQGMERAGEEIAKLSPDEFEKMIFAASMKEGIWEPESLLRVFQVFIRKEVRGVLYQSEVLRKSANEVRRLCAVNTLEPPETPAAIATQQAELYDFPEHLNPVHLPIELGDVFEAHAGLEFALAEQPCDLMVRSDGGRANEIYEALLLPVRKERPGRANLAFELPFYYEDGRSAWIYLNKPVFAPMLALDITVFNSDGRSAFNARNRAPEGLWPSWEKRYMLMVDRVREVLPIFESIEKLRRDGAIDDTLRKKLVATLLHADATSGRRIKGKILSDGTFEYDVRRVRRILPLRAHAMLSRYALHMARDAFDFDLAATVGSL